MKNRIFLDDSQNADEYKEEVRTEAKEAIDESDEFILIFHPKDADLASLITATRPHNVGLWLSFLEETAHSMLKRATIARIIDL